MYNKVTQDEEKWGGVDSTIDGWLGARKLLLIQYCELAGLPPFDSELNALPDNQKITSFCATLMDYVSAGHFEVYDQIAQENQGIQNKQQLFGELYPEITITTDIALSFNDNFADTNTAHDLEVFDQQLSDLGQTLERRFAMEDQLIDNLHHSA
jgi:regulator of sigma D